MATIWLWMGLGWQGFCLGVGMNMTTRNDGYRDEDYAAARYQSEVIRLSSIAHFVRRHGTAASVRCAGPDLFVRILVEYTEADGSVGWDFEDVTSLEAARASLGY